MSTEVTEMSTDVTDMSTEVTEMSTEVTEMSTEVTEMSTEVISWRCVLYTNIDQTLVNSLHGLLNCEIGGLECHVITPEYRTRIYCIQSCNTYCVMY